MARLPTVGSDAGNWGDILNDYLSQSHKPDGSLRADVANIADLKALDVSQISDKMQALVGGYYAHGDGGGGQFYYDASASDTDNSGTVIAPDDARSGRWKRVINEDALTLPMFGIFPHATTDQTIPIQAVIDLAASLQMHLFAPAGTYRVKYLRIKANMYLVGAGQGTVFKLTDDAVSWDAVLGTGSGVNSGINNVVIRDLLTDGNKAQFTAQTQMHGILCQGAHDNWLIQNVTAKDTFSDGIWVTSAASGTLIPTNIRIEGHVAIDCGRQDVAIVNVDGCTVSNCTGNGRFDVEANSNTETCRALVISNIRYNEVVIGTLTATNGGTTKNLASVSNVYSATDISIWGMSFGTISNVSCGGVFKLSKCYRCTVTGVVATHMRIGSSDSSDYGRECSISNAVISGDGGTLDYGILLSQAINCSLSNVEVSCTTPSGDGIRISSATAYGSPYKTVLTDIIVRTHNNNGIFVVADNNMNNNTTILSNALVLVAGNDAIRHSAAGTFAKGTLIIRGCRAYGRVSVQDAESVQIDGLTIVGDYNLELMSLSGGTTVDIDNVKFIRLTAGTPSLTFFNSTALGEIRIGKIQQFPTGSFTASFTNAVFSGSSKVWIDGPVVESTGWLSNLADANIRSGSMYRLRGNTTNYAYTHNGTAWVAKAH